MSKKPKPTGRVNNLVVISDLHSGCATSLVCPDGVELDDGGCYRPSIFQQKIWEWWAEFWQWVDEKTHGEEFDLVINGDMIQGKPHGSIHQVSDNEDVQKRIVLDVLEQPKKLARKTYCVRGTEAHGGKSLENEETVARELGATPDEHGRFSRYTLWKLIGRTPEGILVNCMHHIGTTGSLHYETTAILKELAEAYNEAGRWNERAPDCVVRSHRHRCAMVTIPASPPQCWGVSLTTPGWQGMTPFAAKIPGARQAMPQFGGVLIREAPDGVWYATPWVRSFTREKPEQ
jgi:hypothetical protein